MPVPYVTIIVTAIITVGVGQAFLISKEYLSKASEGKFSALYAALFFEQYAGWCSRWLSEKEVYEGSDGHQGNDHGMMPELPPFPSEIEWKKLGLAFTEDSFSFRVEVNAADINIRYLAEFDPPDGGDFELRNELVKLGLSALDIAQRLRSSAKLKAPHHPYPEYTIQRHLAERRDALEEIKRTARSAREKAQQALESLRASREADANRRVEGE